MHRYGIGKLGAGQLHTIAGVSCKKHGYAGFRCYIDLSGCLVCISHWPCELLFKISKQQKNPCVNEHRDMEVIELLSGEMYITGG